MKFSLKCVCVGLLAVACGGPLETPSDPASPPLASQESELCSDLSVTSLTLTGASTYQGELAGSGNWAVSTFANAVHLEYYVDGVLQAREDRPGKSGSWSFSRTGLDCAYLHEFQVKAWPMVIDSNGGRTTCMSGSKTVSKTVGEDCVTHQPCATCHVGNATTRHTTRMAADPCSRGAETGPSVMNLFERVHAR